MIECGLSGGNEKSCLHCQLMVANQRVVDFRIVLTNHEFSMNSMVANQNAECGPKRWWPIRMPEVERKIVFYYVYRFS